MLYEGNLGTGNGRVGTEGEFHWELCPPLSTFLVPNFQPIDTTKIQASVQVNDIGECAHG